MATFITSDTHFNHKNIIRYCNRPFVCIEEMNAILIYNWNEVVGPEDTVYHLGDLFFGSRTKAEVILDQLNGSITLVLGNHDRHRKQLAFFKEMGIYTCKTFRMVLDGHELLMVHEPEGRAEKGSILLHGHTHCTMPRTAAGVDVGVDAWNYTPTTFEKVIECALHVSSAVENISHRPI